MAKLPTAIIVLCACRGRIAGSLPLSDISQFFQRVAPDVQVVINDDLCNRNDIHRLGKELGSQALIIGACSQLRPKLYFWEGVASNVPCSIRVIDILDELSMPYDSKIAVERIKLLLWAQMKRVSQFKQIRKDNLKLTFSKPGEKVNRREFLVLPLPRYEIITLIESSKCIGGDKCRLCYDNCPLRAVTVRGSVVTIDNNVCNGCGICVAECPRRAVYYPAYSFDELDSEMEGLLLDEGIPLEPRIIAVGCQTCLMDSGIGEGQIVYAPNTLPLKLPCLGMVSPWLMLRAFDMGAQGLAIISGLRECRSHFNMAALKGNIEFVQAVLEHWGVAPGRLRLFEVTETNVTEIADELDRFAARIMNLGSTTLKLAERTPISAGGLKLPALLAAMNNRLMQNTEGSISKGVVPFGKITLDDARCTGCGLCAMNCPTDALTLQSRDGDYQLFFHHGSCVACGMCLNVCPEKCLELQRILEIDKICRGEPILFDSILSCRRCGKPVAPKSMITNLRSKLQKAGCPVDQLELCPICKAETVRYKTVEKEDNVVSTISKGLASKSRAGLGGI